MDSVIKYSELMEYARALNSYCFVFFVSPPQEEIFPGEYATTSYIDDYHTGIFLCAHNSMNITIDVKNPDWETIEKDINGIITSAKNNPTKRYVICDMERLIENKSITDHIWNLFRPVVEANFTNIVLPERIISTLDGRNRQGIEASNKLPESVRKLFSDLRKKREED